METSAVTTQQGPRWVSVSEAARLLGEHRQQLVRMIRIGTFPSRYLDKAAKPPRILLADGLDRAVRNCKRVRVDPKAAPRQPRASQPSPAAVEPAAQVAADREAAWVAAYAGLRDWITDGFSMALLKALPDPAPVGDVMVECRRLLLERLADLDQLETTSRVTASRTPASPARLPAG